MKKKLLLSISLFATLSLSAQQYTWQWAKRGGGIKNAPSESGGGYVFSCEHVTDVVVDADNNYYFLSYLTQQSTEYDGISIPSYNAMDGNSGGMDLCIVSTTCDGTFRWSQTIGGAVNDFGFKLGLDHSGGLYLTANVTNVSGNGPSFQPPHFSPDVALPVSNGTWDTQDALRTAAVVKYNTNNGSLAWYKMLQGSVSINNSASLMGPIIVDNNNNIRVLVGFQAGTHLDGQVTVSDSFIGTAKFFIVTLNPQGEYVNITNVPMEGIIEQSQTKFLYDQNLDRYYIAGYRTYPGNIYLLPLTYNQTAFQKAVFVMAIDSQGNEIWRKEETTTPEYNTTTLDGFAMDNDSNFYITGTYNTNGGVVTSFSNYTFPFTGGAVAYVLKMNPSGQVIWGSTPETETSRNFPYAITVNGNEVAVATAMFQETWDEVTINRGDNYLPDPVVLRLHKDTGVAFAIHDVRGPFGLEESFTAIATDNDGNYVLGGYFRDQLFTDPNDGVETLYKVNNITNYTDFFMAKLAAGPCGVPANTAENNKKTPLLYPNPANNEITLQYLNQQTQYSITNLLGQTLLNGVITPNNSTINIQNLQTGTYILSLSNDNGPKSNLKFIKK